MEGIKILFYTMCVALLVACDKQDEWLDIKPRSADVVPSKLQDYQGILDNSGELNNRYPNIAIISSDNFYITYDTWQTISVAGIYRKNAYIWAPDIFEGSPSPHWNYLYQNIGRCNIVFEGLEKIDRTTENSSQWDQVKGSALFFRAFNYFELAQLFCKPYSTTASSDPGLPIRLNANANEPSVRASVEATYDLMINDLQLAKDLLPPMPDYQTRPSKLAALALLSRIYLNMNNYTLALQYANDALDINSTLIDLNSLDVNAARPFPTFVPGNPEVALYINLSAESFMNSPTLIIEPELLDLYREYDLRMPCFYNITPAGFSFKGNYNGFPSSTPFGGITINELYLIKAEALARLNRVDESLAALNTLLINRYETGNFNAYANLSAKQALDLILSERRKELPFAGSLRWQDLRRLNQEPEYAKTLTRVLDGRTYTLPPNDNRYVLPIPEDEIRLSGIQQNPR